MSFRPRVPTLHRYVLRESVLPFFLGFGLVTVLFYMDFLFDYLDLLLAKGVPAPAVIELFLLALGWIVALSFPCGVLVSALMTFGRLAQDQEVTAMRGLGVNLGAILRAPLLAALLLSALLASFNNWVLPETNHRFANLQLAIHRKRPAAKIEPGIFINAFDDYSLLVKGVDGKRGVLTDVTIYDYSSGTVPSTILAAGGTMKYIEGGTILRLDLEDGEIHVVPGIASEGKYRQGRFETHTLLLRNTGAVLQRADRKSRGEREMNVSMLASEVRRLVDQRDRRLLQLDSKAKEAGYATYEAFERSRSGPGGFRGILQRLLGKNPEATADSLEAPKAEEAMQIDRTEVESLNRRIDSFKVEIHKKFSIPFACVVFVLVGAPLGIRTRKGGFANMAIAVAFFVLYYLFLIGGEQLADRRLLSPFLSMWLPNVVFGTLGVYLTASIMGWGPSRGMR